MFLESFLIGIGLSMDAFAVSVCKGLSMDKINKKEALIIALYFGIFQAIMPLFGWVLGIQLEQFVSKYAHIIAFFLLLFIGGKMIKEAVFNKNEENQNYSKISHKELFVLAIATSIDALAVGISYALLNKSIIYPVVIIGLTTFFISILGVLIGNKFGSKYQSKSEIFGGVILILIGIKILILG